MEDTLVSLEVAKLLKTKGFSAGSNHYYDTSVQFGEDAHPVLNLCNGNIACYVNGLSPYIIEAPTQSLAQKWLRDTKSKIIIVDVDFTELECYYCNVYDHTKMLSFQTKSFVTYEEALEGGLLVALKSI